MSDILRCAAGQRGTRSPWRTGRGWNARHGQVTDQLAVVVDHRRKRHTARPRHRVGDDPIEEVTSPGPLKVELGETGRLHEAHAVSYSEGFLAYRLPRV